MSAQERRDSDSTSRSPISPMKTSRSVGTFSETFSLAEKYHPTDNSPNSASPQTLHAKPWPSRPQLLYKGLGGYRWWDSTVDVIMILIPIPFFILGAAVIAVNGKEVNAHELELLQQSIKGATTIFPICFAAIVGRASVKYATWRLERGTTLGTLEQLMGSRTVASAFTTQLQLRTFNLVGLALLIIWSLSPIGGQSILHILFTPMKSTSSLTNISYYNSRAPSLSSPAGSFANQWFGGFSVLLGSSILAPTAVKRSSMDIWGNPKIPLFSTIATQNSKSDSEGWVQVPLSSGNVTYSSLFGLPLYGINPGNTSLNVESTYIELSCFNKSTSPMVDIVKTDLISTVGPFVSFQNATRPTPWAIGYKGPDVTNMKVPDDNDNSSYIYPQACPDCLPADFASMTFEPGTLVFQEYDGLDNITSIFCTPSQKYIESIIFCTKYFGSQTCQVTAQRPSRLPHMPLELTYLSFGRVAMGLTALLPNSTVQFTSINQLQNYIYDPLSTARILSTPTSVSNNLGETPLQDVAEADFAQRFGQLLNAYMYASLWNSTPYILGEPFTSIEFTLTGYNDASFIPATTAELTDMILNKTTAFTVSAVQTNAQQVYFAFFPWLGIFLISNLIMLLAAIIGVYFSRKTIVPDYLGFVSSLAKESPFIRMPDVGVNMDGMDKARMVKEMKVRLGDVSDMEGRSNIGRLAFARMEETTMVKKGKLYV